MRHPPRTPTAVAPGDLLAFSPQRDRFGVARRIQMLAKRGDRANPGLTKLKSSAERETWSKTVAACQDTAHAGEALSAPTDQVGMEVKFVDALTHIQQDQVPWLTSQYTKCMQAKGVPANDLADAYLKVERAFPPVTFDQVSDPTQLPDWAAAVAFENRTAEADWMCRHDAVDTVMAAAGPSLTQFQQANTDALTANTRSWAGLPAAVAALRARATTS